MSVYLYLQNTMITKSNFTNKAITTIHDNLLADLYSLTLDTVYYENIDGEPYLINETSGRGYHIGLQVKIPVDMLTFDNKVLDYKDLSTKEQNVIIKALKERLFFSNAEILMSNILLDKFLNKSNIFDISFLEIESHYRKNNSSKRVQISNYNYKRYINVINKLASKEVFIKTTGKFRKNKYSVNNLSFQQPFLILFDYCRNGKNNILFSYSFDRFGDVLKLSERLSNGVPPSAYSCRLNQCKLHSVYYFLGREVFVRKGMLLKHPRLESYKYFRLDIKKLMREVHYENTNGEVNGYSFATIMDGYNSQPNKFRTYKLFIKYILIALKEMKNNHIIYDYEEKYNYTETDNFVEKYQDDYLGDNLKLVHLFSVNEIGPDVDIEITIYLEPVEFKMS